MCSFLFSDGVQGSMHYFGDKRPVRLREADSKSSKILHYQEGLLWALMENQALKQKTHPSTFRHQCLK
jgi:hypothetical protein